MATMFLINFLNKNYDKYNLGYSKVGLAKSALLSLFSYMTVSVIVVVILANALLRSSIYKRFNQKFMSNQHKGNL